MNKLFFHFCRFQFLWRNRDLDARSENIYIQAKRGLRSFALDYALYPPHRPIEDFYLVASFERMGNFHDRPMLRCVFNLPKLVNYNTRLRYENRPY